MNNDSEYIWDQFLSSASCEEVPGLYYTELDFQLLGFLHNLNNWLDKSEMSRRTRATSGSLIQRAVVEKDVTIAVPLGDYSPHLHDGLFEYVQALCKGRIYSLEKTSEEMSQIKERYKFDVITGSTFNQCDGTVSLKFFLKIERRTIWIDIMRRIQVPRRIYAGYLR